jgi:hypothetical protein
MQNPKFLSEIREHIKKNPKNIYLMNQEDHKESNFIVEKG